MFGLQEMLVWSKVISALSWMSQGVLVFGESREKRELPLKKTGKLSAVVHACKSQYFGRLKQVDHLRSEVQDQPDQHGETPPLLEIQKLAGCGGVNLYSQLFGGLRREDRLNQGPEVAVSPDSTTALQPGRQSKTPPQKRKKDFGQ